MSQQNELTFLVATDQINPDCGTRVDLAGRNPIAVFRLGEEFFATDDTCSHGAASLSEGDVTDGMVECPFHSGGFDIRTGEAKRLPCTKAIAVYPVVIENGQVYVRLAAAVDLADSEPCSHHKAAAK